MWATGKKKSSTIADDIQEVITTTIINVAYNNICSAYLLFLVAFIIIGSASDASIPPIVAVKI